MNKPRTPRYFPRMKVRGARRRRVAPIDLMVGAFERMGQAATVLARSFGTLPTLLKVTGTGEPSPEK